VESGFHSDQKGIYPRPVLTPLTPSPAINTAVSYPKFGSLPIKLVKLGDVDICVVWFDQGNPALALSEIHNMKSDFPKMAFLILANIR